MESAEAEIEALCSIWDGVHVAEASGNDEERHLKHKIKSLEDEMMSASVVIEMTIFNGYPTVPPRVILSNPRGIGEPEFQELQRQIRQIIEENSDEMPIICEIFQHCCDYLTENQHTNMDCSICLLCLSTSPIHVTQCDHFMHATCFCRYLQECSDGFQKEIQDAQPHMKERVETNILCPVCREQLTESNTIHNYRQNIQEMKSQTKKNQKTLSAKKRRISTTTEDVQKTMKTWKEEQRRLAKIFEKQKKKGGIIDVEEDKKRREFYIEVGNSNSENPVDEVFDEEN
ncbi:unnamed protein product [Caenorhabditis nigoni]|uniref:RWD domain-containing protein n=1 Tax=Caenorhabditis nigoni TaxID=1611254 RepID=A0A2G5UP13_9PELO|nr:hypothetical protein B9Z55_008723 [Caenorhabditis nigoni]